MLADTKEKVLAKQAQLKDRKLENLDPQLRKVAGFAFYNTSRYDFEKLLADAPARRGEPAELHRRLQPETQIVQGKTVCVVSCQRSPEPVFLKWKGIEAAPRGDFFVRSGPGTVKLPPESAREYIRTRFGGLVRDA